MKNLMVNNRQRIWFFLIAMLILFSLPFVYSEIQTLGTFKQNTCIVLKQTCANCTYTNITSVLSPNSTAIITDVNMTQNGTEYLLNFCNTAYLGQYIINGLSDVDGVKTIWAYDFNITPRGNNATTSQAIIYIGAILLLIIFFIICLYGFINDESPTFKLLSLFGCYILLVIISYVVWLTTENVIMTTQFLARFFYWIFIILMVGFVPMVIASIVWYFWLLMNIKQIKTMIEKGVPENEAYERTIRRSKFK